MFAKKESDIYSSCHTILAEAMARPEICEELQHALDLIQKSALEANPGNTVHVEMVMGLARELVEGKSMTTTEARAARGGTQYRLEKLLEALLMGRLLKNASDLPVSLTRSMGFLLGAQAAEICSKGIAAKKIDVPSPASLSRARLKADILLMRLRAWDRIQSSRQSKDVLSIFHCSLLPNTMILTIYIYNRFYMVTYYILHIYIYIISRLF